MLKQVHPVGCSIGEWSLVPVHAVTPSSCSFHIVNKRQLFEMTCSEEVLLPPDSKQPHNHGGGCCYAMQCILSQLTVMLGQHNITKGSFTCDPLAGTAALPDKPKKVVNTNKWTSYKKFVRAHTCHLQRLKPSAWFAYDCRPRRGE